MESPIEKWLDIVQYDLSNGLQENDYYERAMYQHTYYDNNKSFLIMHGSDTVAAITIISNPETKDGYIHMVGCKPEYRGKGLGKLLNQIAIKTLKDDKMETAYLTTDDWRLPAIKGYLKSGFTPDLSSEEFVQRWEKVMEQINNQ